VVTRAAGVDDAGVRHRPGVHATVRDVLPDGRYVLESVDGARLALPRALLQLEKIDLLAPLALRQHDHARLEALSEHIVLTVVVGSRAWGLDDASSDEDVRGCFVLPFEDHASLYAAPDEIHRGERAYWEIEKLVRQALRADPNTLETLWSPLVQIERGAGARLRREREIFSSLRVVDAFGRYATSQLEKLVRSAARRRSLAALLEAVEAGRARDETAALAVLRSSAGADHDVDGDEVRALVRSSYDRGLIAAASYASLVEAVERRGAPALLPEEVRPKNAYNLVRLLHSCARWLEDGEPLVRVEGPLRATLLDIKHGRLTLDRTFALAAEAAAEVDALVRRGATRLPAEPQWDAAAAIVRDARRDAARVVFAPTAPASTGSSPITAPSATSNVAEGLDADRYRVAFAPTPLPLDVDLPALRAFLEARASLLPGPFLVVGLTGAHAYGFPSPDSDLDLKAIHVAPANALLGLSPRTAPLEHVEVWGGREMDLSSHELLQAAQLLLKGNGNMLERLLGPCVVLRSPLGEDLARLAERSLSARVVHHYRGFFERMVEELGQQRVAGAMTAKKLLYVHRVALTGAHLLKTGALVTDVRALAPPAGFEVDALLARKRTGEHVALAGEDHDVDATIARLRALLEEAGADTVLPAEPPADVVRELDAFVAGVRLHVPSS
jgi:predicted nucleotidyltransferase